MNLRQAISTFRGHRVPNVDFMGKKKIWFALSGVFILLSIVGLAARQLNFSIAFTGGSLLEFSNRRGAAVQEYQQIMSRFGLPDAQVEVIGANQISIRTESLAEVAAPEPSPSPSPETTASASGSPEASPSATSSEGAASTPTATGSASPAASASAGPGITGRQSVRADELRAALARKAGIPVDQINETDVGPTWGATISRKMITGLVVFLVLVSLYITLRFEWKMALGALGALLHDLIITTGVFALVGREITPETVIAILTILGYSLYDTVVIYDKVKENTESAALIAQNTYSGVVNISLNQTLMRSVNTSLVVLLPIGALLLFGGQTLKDFAFALFIGVASGTYSSIFVAAPVLAVLKEREPRFQQIQVRARSRAARPGLRAVPAASVPGRVGTTDTVTPAAEPASASTRTMVGSTGAARRTGATGTGPKRKKSRPQGKPKRRRR